VKALVDTNPLVSALLKPDGPSGQIFQRWRAGKLELVVSPSTLAELREVLRRPHIANKYKLSAPDIEHHLNVLRNFAEIAPGRLSLDLISADPQDNHVLAAGVETRYSFIVSGDHHLLDLDEYQSVRILTPRDFLTLLEANPTREAGNEA